MRPLLTLLALALLIPASGCDVIYERPELELLVDFGEPYAIGLEAAMAPAGVLATPYVSNDNKLVVDVTYRADCTSSRFTVDLDVRDGITADLWLVHRAVPGSCGSDVEVSERLSIPLPSVADQVPRLVLLTPDQGALVLKRALG